MKKVLIIEDDPLMSGVYSERFQTAGFDVAVAGSGAEALAALQRSTPDLVLLDLMLGDISGVKVLEFIRSQPATRPVPVLVLSNAYMGDLVQAAWKAGANKCLSKTTCSPNRLLDEVRTLLAAAPGPITPAAANLPPPLPAATAPAPNAPGAPPASQTQLRAKLVETIRTHLGDARVLLHEWVKSPTGEHAKELSPLYRAIHAVAGAAGLAGFARLAQVATALEALLGEIQASPAKINASAVRTVTQALELLPALFKNIDTARPETVLSPLVLVVDDDAISRETLRTALEKAQVRPLTIEDPAHALRLFDENTFDLVFLDVDMPAVSGFDLCEKLHASAANIMTPVVFVTALSDFQTRTQSTESGAVDFIAKPVGLVETAVKALVHLHRGRLLAAT